SLKYEGFFVFVPFEIAAPFGKPGFWELAPNRQLCARAIAVASFLWAYYLLPRQDCQFGIGHGHDRYTSPHKKI
ncbi:hypothetical protein ACGK9U_06580, partial [Mariniflexile sp. HNIBRBA6329]|uniref:hypothetical protein n=1 Tax=Mariniflexile sp. HNIBRBA6329 TaxID=3373088 RepID=UPI003746902F